VGTILALQFYNHDSLSFVGDG